MATFRMKYVKAFTDRHGKLRCYYRRPGFPSVALAGEPGSKQFAEAYEAATSNAPRKIGEERVLPGTFNALIAEYYETAAYQDLQPITKATYRNALERFRKAFGNVAVKAMTPGAVDELLEGGRHDTLRKVLNLIFKLAVRRGQIKVNPMTGLRRPKKAAKGFRAWSEEDIAAFEARWPSGSRERLALALLLYTGQRRSDVVTRGRQHVSGGTIRVVQQKTGTELAIKIHSALKAEIEAAPKGHLNLLTTQYGKPFTAAGFGNWFRDAAKAAGLPAGYNAHGLRKAAARRMAEAGCTPHQIMAVTGHKNLSEVTLYTASADQQRLAAEAIGMVEPGTKTSTSAVADCPTVRNVQ